MAELSEIGDCTLLAAFLFDKSSTAITPKQLLALHKFIPLPHNLLDIWLAEARAAFNNNKYNSNNTATQSNNISQPHPMALDLRYSVVSHSTQESSEPAGSQYRSSIVSAGSSHTSAYSEFPYKRHIGDKNQPEYGIDNMTLPLRMFTPTHATSNIGMTGQNGPSNHRSAPPPLAQASVLACSANTGGMSGSNFFCTRCNSVFRHKNDWNRHEQTEHEHQVVFICMPYGPIESSPDGPRCSSCHELDPTSDHMEREHSAHRCPELPFDKRKQHYWLDRFNRHHRDHFTCPKDCSHAQQWRFELPKRLAYYCGFAICSEKFSTWNDWFNHVAAHIEREGMRREYWNHTKIIWCLLMESRMIKAWNMVLNKHFPGDFERPAITWSGHSAAAIQQLLEHSQESPVWIATAAFKQSSEGWRTHQIGPTPPTYDMLLLSNLSDFDLIPEHVDQSVTGWLPPTQDASSDPYVPFTNEADNGGPQYPTTPISESPDMFKYPDSSKAPPHGLDHSYNTANLSLWARNAGVISFNETPVLSSLPDRTPERPQCPKTPLQAFKGVAKKLVPRRSSDTSRAHQERFIAPHVPTEQPSFTVADTSFLYDSHGDSPMSGT